MPSKVAILFGDTECYLNTTHEVEVSGSVLTVTIEPSYEAFSFASPYDLIRTLVPDRRKIKSSTPAAPMATSPLLSLIVTDDAQS